MRVVLHELADFLNPEGQAFPSLDLLAERAVVSRATVMRTLEEAVVAGYLIKAARSRKRNIGGARRTYAPGLLASEPCAACAGLWAAAQWGQLRQA